LASKPHGKRRLRLGCFGAMPVINADLPKTNWFTIWTADRNIY
jgi:hypothetical protein